MNRIAQQSIARRLMLTLVIAGAVGLSGPARAQNLIPIPTCRQIWDDAANEAARAALARANRDAGAAPNGAATAWSSSWTQSWRAAWTSAGGTLVPGKDGDCCHIDWFELAVMAGKNGWTQAWQAAPNLSGAAAAWQAKFAAAYADEWANVWFVYYPWLCAKAKVNVAVNAAASAKASAQAGAFAWANAFALAGAFATSWQDSFSMAWGESSASAWAATGATALTSAQASASSWAAAGVSGDCATARAGSCAEAAASAFASAWAEAGASAFANAYAYAWADAYAAAFANSWSQAQATAGGVALASAASKAFASAVADSYAAVWREKLANVGQVKEVVAWWTVPGAPRPNLKKISLLLAREQMNTSKTVFANALKNAQSGQIAWTIAFGQAADQASKYASAEAEIWVSSWAQQWANAWAYAWMETYIQVCSRAAAAVCKTCPCTTTTGQTGERPHTVSRPTGFTYTLVGLGVNAGTIFEFVVTNTTDQPIVVEIPAGTVFKPDQPTVQREVTDQPQTVAAAPQQTAQTPLTGYCLDYGLQAPPAGIRGALQSNGALVAAVNADAVLAALPQTPSVKYTVDDNPAGYAPILKIIQAGNQLSSQGKFHRDLPPDRYKLAVIQRAIWTYTSKGGKTPHTRETMLADIKKQVRETGGEQTDAQINDLVNHLQEDIIAVLSAAGVQ